MQGTSKNLTISSNLLFLPLPASDKKSNRIVMTRFITPCHERKIAVLDSCEVFRGALQKNYLFHAYMAISVCVINLKKLGF
ncbi:MAG: hypothetical protein COB41_06615 [Proteobacteria bacterium]|nr:MAG: hypothetical protein COB41_06615 [Pseudomonadota bacterium]